MSTTPRISNFWVFNSFIVFVRPCQFPVRPTRAGWRRTVPRLLALSLAVLPSVLRRRAGPLSPLSSPVTARAAALEVRGTGRPGRPRAPLSVHREVETAGLRGGVTGGAGGVSAGATGEEDTGLSQQGMGPIVPAVITSLVCQIGFIGCHTKCRNHRQYCWHNSLDSLSPGQNFTSHENSSTIFTFLTLERNPTSLSSLTSQDSALLHRHLEGPLDNYFILSLNLNESCNFLTQSGNVKYSSPRPE